MISAITRGFDNLQIILSKPAPAVPPIPAPLPLIPPNVAEATARFINAYATILERPDPKPITEVIPTYPEELQTVLEMARNNQSLRGKLPPHIQRILEEEEMELG